MLQYGLAFYVKGNGSMRNIYQFSLSLAEKGQSVSTVCSSLKELEVRGLLIHLGGRLLGGRDEKMVCFFY